MWVRIVSRSTYNCDVSPADHSASATNGISRIIGTCKRGAAISSLRQKQDLIQTSERALSFNHDKRQNKIATVSTTTSRTPPTDWQTRQEHNIKQIGVATMPQDTSLLVTCCKLFSTAATACSCKTSIRNAGKVIWCLPQHLNLYTVQQDGQFFVVAHEQQYLSSVSRVSVY